MTPELNSDQSYITKIEILLKISPEQKCAKEDNTSLKVKPATTSLF